MTVHRYPLRNCYVPPSSPQYPTIAHLLSQYATAGLAASLKRWVGIAHAQHRQLRVDELNSVACRGKAGVSDTFASSLWVDRRAVLAGPTRASTGSTCTRCPMSAYELFQFSHAGGRWQRLGAARLLRPAAVRPGGPARLAAAAGCRAPRRRRSVLSAWATRGARPDRRGWS